MLLPAALLACRSEPDDPPPASVGPPLAAAVLEALSMERIRDDVELLGDESVGGRVPGTPGHDFARDYLAAEMAAAGLEPVGGAFGHDVTLALERSRLGLDAAGDVVEVGPQQLGTNLFGVRPGVDAERGDEVVLLVAHYDHLGVDASGDAYNGAFDDLTAVCALLELARALDAHDVELPRTLGFLFSDAEEDGLDGARAWVADAPVPLSDVAAVLSIDPIGRPVLTDVRPLFTFGSERSPAIVAALDAVAPWLDQPVRRLNRGVVVGYASDQDAFWEAPEPIPSLWVSSGGMTFYHTVDDTPETIDYRSVQEHLGAIAQLATALASAADRPVDIGPQPLSLDDVAQAVATVDDALGSAEITDEERAIGQGYRDGLAVALDTGDPAAPGVLASYLGLLLYVIDELTPAHPGPIPPPFPEARR